jgi:hypothetical protein
LRRRQQPRRIGQHHLPAMRGRRDPRRPVHVQPGIPVLVPARLPRVQTHPDPDHLPAWPVMAGEGPLSRQAAAHRISGRLEHHEKAVALSPQLMAAETAERGPQ